jgi:hypothetical protein
LCEIVRKCSAERSPALSGTRIDALATGFDAGARAGGCDLGESAAHAGGGDRRQDCGNGRGRNLRVQGNSICRASRGRAALEAPQPVKPWSGVRQTVKFGGFTGGMTSAPLYDGKILPAVTARATTACSTRSRGCDGSPGTSRISAAIRPRSPCWGIRLGVSR